MSSSLVKQSLSLFEDDIKEEPLKKKKKIKCPMSLISTKKTGVKQELKKLQKLKKSSGILHVHRSNDLITSAGPYDYTEMSVKALNRISQLDSSNKNTSNTVFEHHSRRKHRKTDMPKDTKQEETSAFSDKDFEDFSKQFDFSKLKKS